MTTPRPEGRGFRPAAEIMMNLDELTGYIFRSWKLRHRGCVVTIHKLPSYGSEPVYTINLPVKAPWRKAPWRKAPWRKVPVQSKPVHGLLTAQLTAIEMIDKYLERSDV